MKNSILLVFLFLIMACNERPSNSTIETAQQSEKAGIAFDDRATTRKASSKVELDKGSKIIKTGNLTFEVSDLSQSKVEVDTLINRYGSYYENEQYNAYGNRISYFLTIRIPSEDFDQVLMELEEGVGRLTSKNINTRDVSEEYVDLTIRLKNNLAYLEQYRDILRKANSVQEILEVKEKIRGIEEEIESRKGRLEYLDNQVEYSTLTIEMSELIRHDVSSRPAFGIRVANAFRGGVDLFLRAIVLLVNLWPFLVLFGVLFFFRKKIAILLRRK